MASKRESVIERAKALQKEMHNTVDGRARDPAQEKELNRACMRLLSTGDGQTVFNWLRSISINNVLGASATNTELAYQEGMRMIVALMDQRRIAGISETNTKKVGK